MKVTTIYAVIQHYYDNGNVGASLIKYPSTENEPLPERVFEEHKDYDLYIDYFTDKAEAEAFLQDCYRA